MRETIKILLFSVLFSQFCVGQEITRVYGWVDNDHYQVGITENGGKEVQYNINVNTGVKEATKKKINTQERGRFGAQLSNEKEGYRVTSEKNDLFLTSPDKKKVRLTNDKQDEQNPTLSPNNKYVAYTKNNNLYVSSTVQANESKLTSSKDALVYNGWASWVYYEEILGRSSRYKAFWWSPDSKKIAFLQFDDNPVNEFPIFRSEGTHGDLERTRYPKSGDDNPYCKLGVIDIESKKTTWMDHNWTEDIYTAWSFWTPDGDLLYQRLNRDQNHLQFFLADPASGKNQLIYEEKQHTWVDWYTQLQWLNDGKSFLILSDKNGWKNFYQVFLDGSPEKQITNVDWKINRLVEMNEERGGFYFSGSGDDRTTDQHIYFARLDGSKVRQLTKKRGVHRVEFSDDGEKMIDYYSNLNQPLHADLIDLSTMKVTPIIDNAFNANEDKGIKVELHTIPTKDGFDLPAYWVLPPNFNPEKVYPVVFNLYGGPGSEGVRDSYRNFTWNGLVSKGVIIMSVDHRGCGKFGKTGKNYMHRNLGKWEIEDYVTAVKWLYQYDFIDKNRIGIQGGSYGGYVAALALCAASDYFTHGISSYPVTDWRLYDNVYTERYMDTPESNPKGYDYGSVLSHTQNLKGKLLIIHGEMDDNVHMQNSMQLISKLQDEGKQFEMMVYPGERHGWGGAKRKHLMVLKENFWDRHFELKDIRP